MKSLSDDSYWLASKPDFRVPVAMILVGLFAVAIA